MGQDRELSQEQLNFVLDVVQDYSKRWTDLENNNLTSDIQLRNAIHENDKELIDGEDAERNRFEDEENNYLNDYFAEMYPDEPVDEDTRAEQTPELRRKWITDKVCSDEFKEKIMELKKFKVIKYSACF